MSDSDLYIGKIVKSKYFYDYAFDKQDIILNNTIPENLYYYKKDQLFLVVGTKLKTYVWGDGLCRKNDYYILKPLQDDVDKKNLDRQLVWCFDIFYVGSSFLNNFTIID